MENSVVFDPKDIDLEEDICWAIKDIGEHIHVVVKDGDVHLSGDMDDSRTKKAIEEAVQRVPGVRYVVNHIRVQARFQIRFPWNEKGPEGMAFRSLLLK
jgi:hypothetical protein